MGAPTIAADTLRSVLEAAARRLAAAGVEGPRRDAQLLLAHALGARPELVLGHPERSLTPACRARFEALVERRAAREPVSRILGRREFWSLPFRLAPTVLDPRPESEVLVEAVVARLPQRAAPRALLDLGTGSGCLLLALLAELPGTRGLGVDRDAQALAAARDNAAALGLEARAEFRVSDWGAELEGSFDVIVANPPYVAEHEWPALPPEVRLYDPPGALVGGADGLAAYRALLPRAARLLAAGGLLALEHGERQGPALRALLARHRLAAAAEVRDLAGRERCLLATAATGSA